METTDEKQVKPGKGRNGANIHSEVRLQSYSLNCKSDAEALGWDTLCQVREWNSASGHFFHSFRRRAAPEYSENAEFSPLPFLSRQEAGENEISHLKRKNKELLSRYSRKKIKLPVSYQIKKDCLVRTTQP